MAQEYIEMPRCEPMAQEYMELPDKWPLEHYDAIQGHKAGVPPIGHVR